MVRLFSSLIAISTLIVTNTADASPRQRAGGYATAGLGKQNVFAAGQPGRDDGYGQAWKQGEFSYALGLGYRFGANLAVETTFQDQLDATRVPASPNAPATALGGELSASLLAVSTVATLPIGDRLELFGRLGTGKLDSRYTPDAAIGLGAIRSHDNARIVGLGGNVYLGRDSFVRMEWNRVRTRGASATAQAMGYERLRTTQVTLMVGHHF
ncbi:MAG TPA: hypothetical protein DCP40_02335 [Stenotrophomonas sp.]|nr:hypothetical protein [Stenotrophomonas sp.]